LYTGSFLFDSGYDFGRAFAYAKQEAAFAAGIAHPNEALPSAILTTPPPCRYTPEAPRRVRQKRKLIHPFH
jgi:hypothetical protein